MNVTQPDSEFLLLFMFFMYQNRKRWFIWVSPAKLSQCHTKKALKGLLKWTASRNQGDREWDKLIFSLGWWESERGREHLLCMCMCVRSYLWMTESNELWHMNVPPPCLAICLRLCQSFQFFIYLSFPNLHFLLPRWIDDILLFSNLHLVMMIIKVNYVKAVQHITYPGMLFADSNVDKLWSNGIHNVWALTVIMDLIIRSTTDKYQIRSSDQIWHSFSKIVKCLCHLVSFMSVIRLLQAAH